MVCDCGGVDVSSAYLGSTPSGSRCGCVWVGVTASVLLHMCGCLKSKCRLDLLALPAVGHGGTHLQTTDSEQKSVGE